MTHNNPNNPNQEHDPALNAELNRLVDELLDQSVTPKDAANAIDAFKNANETANAHHAKRTYNATNRALQGFNRPFETPDFVHSVINKVDKRSSFASTSERVWVSRFRRALAAAAVVALGAGFLIQRINPSPDTQFTQPHTSGVAIAQPVLTSTAQSTPPPATPTPRERLRSFTSELATNALPPFPQPTFDFDHSHLLSVINADQSKPNLRIIRDFRIQPGNLGTPVVGIEFDSADHSTEQLIELIGQFDANLTTDSSATIVTDEQGNAMILVTASNEIASQIGSIRQQIPRLAESLVPEGVRWIVLQSE